MIPYLAGFTVTQSSMRMPPVSPELAFMHQKVQLDFLPTYSMNLLSHLWGTLDLSAAEDSLIPNSPKNSLPLERLSAIAERAGAWLEHFFRSSTEGEGIAGKLPALDPSSISLDLQTPDDHGRLSTPLRH